MKKLQQKLAEVSQFPELDGWEFRFIREEMGITQQGFGRVFSKSYYWTADIEKRKRRRVKIKYVKVLRDIDPELFFKAYSLLP